MKGPASGGPIGQILLGKIYRDLRKSEDRGAKQHQRARFGHLGGFNTLDGDGKSAIGGAARGGACLPGV